MRHEQRERFKEMAERVASRLFADLMAGRLAKVGIEEIRTALRQETECPRDAKAFDALEYMTCRRVVEMAG